LTKWINAKDSFYTAAGMGGSLRPRAKRPAMQGLPCPASGIFNRFEYITTGSPDKYSRKARKNTDTLPVHNISCRYTIVGKMRFSIKKATEKGFGGFQTNADTFCHQYGIRIKVPVIGHPRFREFLEKNTMG